MDLVCWTPGCSRTPPGGWYFCGGCRRWIPVETLLALNGHIDAWDQPGFTEIREFLHWSNKQTVLLAALQAWEAAPNAKTDSWTLGRVVAIRQALGL